MLRIFLLLKWKSLKAELQYPVNFISGLLGTSLIGVTDILLLLIQEACLYCRRLSKRVQIPLQCRLSSGLVKVDRAMCVQVLG